ncbi:tryptophan halogenase family protein [Neptunicella sp. SCSIO 80796]|uniref:tryptophan halogenase family protein n=1 Tax=Neptunicella plasticusilytica TaxID=3117012 RepID=UPI003A4D74D9
MSTPVNKIVIVGGGTAGWMAAASLARYGKGQLAITLIESSQMGTVGVGEATIPNIVDFNRNLGIDEIEFIKATQATFKLGIQFEHWRQPNHHFFHPFSDYGVKIDNVEFHQYLHRLIAAGDKVELADYSFSCALAKGRRFAQPHPNPPTPLADYSYAYHFDAGLYANFLRDVALEQGVTHIDAKISQVSQHQGSGFIRSVTLDDGRQIDGELFIDCSGFKGLLIEETLKTGYEKWSEWLLCDTAMAVQTERVGEPVPFTRTIAERAGWQWRIPLQHRTGNGHIFSSQFEDVEQAQKTLLDSIEGKTVNTPREIRFTPGRRKQIWNKNCFALGLASGFIEPLESTSISLIQTAIAKLLSFFPDQSFNPHDIAEVNRLHNLEVERIRDFIILHYKLSQRDDSAFWRHCRNMTVPDSLQHKIELYQSRGHVVMYDHESFEQASWLTMYHGFGRKPVRFDPRAAVVDINLVRQKLQQMRDSINSAATQAMPHQAFIQQHCPAS